MPRQIATLCSILLLLAGCGGIHKTVNLEKTLKNSVINNKGDALTTGHVLNTEYLLLYFSAHWCAPCRSFTPKLVDFYTENNGGYLFQVLFVSNDRSEKEMLAYMSEAKMPWPGVVYHSETTKKLNKAYSGSGIPRLVLVNRAGHVLADSYKGRKYLGPQHVIAELEKRLDKRKKDPVGISEATGELLPTPAEFVKRYKLEGFATSDASKKALINGKLVQAGSMIDSGVAVTSITETYVEISYEGNRYRLTQK